MAHDYGDAFTTAQYLVAANNASLDARLRHEERRIEEFWDRLRRLERRVVMAEQQLKISLSGGV